MQHTEDQKVAGQPDTILAFSLWNKALINNHHQVHVSMSYDHVKQSFIYLFIFRPEEVTLSRYLQEIKYRIVEHHFFSFSAC